LADRAAGRIVFAMDLRAALVVGCMFSIINQRDVIVLGDVTGGTLLTGDRTTRA